MGRYGRMLRLCGPGKCEDPTARNEPSQVLRNGKVEDLRLLERFEVKVYRTMSIKGCEGVSRRGRRGPRTRGLPLL